MEHKKFEYKIVTLPAQYSVLGKLENHQEYLNREGQDGWDLCSTIGDTMAMTKKTYFTYFFKRPLLNTTV